MLVSSRGELHLLKGVESVVARRPVGGETDGDACDVRVAVDEAGSAAEPVASIVCVAVNVAPGSKRATIRPLLIAIVA